MELQRAAAHRGELCTNAVKYGCAHAPVDITLCPGDHHVELPVHNEGTAIPVEEQARLFEPFQRARSAHAGHEKGWGMGLTLVRGLAEATAAAFASRAPPDGAPRSPSRCRRTRH